MLRNVIIFSLLFTGLQVGQANAETRELARSELRENVRLGKSMSLAQLINHISRRQKHIAEGYFQKQETERQQGSQDHCQSSGQGIQAERQPLGDCPWCASQRIGCAERGQCVASGTSECVAQFPRG